MPRVRCAEYHNGTITRMKVTLFIPTFNEINGIRAVMPRVKREWVDEIIVVDNNSTDGSREYFEALGIPVILQTRRGTLGAWWDGFQAATGDIIIPFSPDNNSVPEVIPQLIEKMKGGYDMVIASRYAKGATSDDDTAVSSLGNRAITLLINILFRANYSDTLVMYRAFRRDILPRLGFEAGTGKEFNKRQVTMFEVLSAIRCARYGFKTADIPGDEPARLDDTGSRVFPNATRRFFIGALILYHIIKERLRPDVRPKPHT